MTLSEKDMIIYAQISHLRKMKKDIDLTIQNLLSLLPDRDPTERRPWFVIHPITGEREEVPRK